MTDAYIIAESFVQRTRTPGTSIYDRLFDEVTIPARIIKVLNIRWVRKAYARSNAWEVSFTIPRSYLIDTESTAGLHQSIPAFEAPRFFATHEGASKALILDRKNADNSAQRASSVQQAQAADTERGAAARATYDAAVQAARAVYHETLRESRVARDAAYAAIPDIEGLSELRTAVSEDHSFVSDRMEFFRSNRPHSSRQDAWGWTGTEHHRAATNREIDSADINMPGVTSRGRYSNWARDLRLPSIIQD